MKALFLDCNQQLGPIFARVRHSDDPPIDVNYEPHDRAAIPQLLAGYGICLDDHSYLPTEVVAHCQDLRHVVFLGTGAASYMDVAALKARGITVHLIKGYGDTAVAEHTIALMFAAAREVASMDRGIRGGGWPRREGTQLQGKTLGLLGYGGIGAEVARIACGIGMRVLAWNRTPRAAEGVEFVALEQLLAESHAVSVHLLLTDETRGFLGAGRLRSLRPGAILVNTARGALVDEGAMVEALRTGQLGHAALDVFDAEPLPPGHPLTTLDNVTLSAHSAFRTPEASENLLRRALDIAAGIAEES